jgi:hypothetical protein
MALERIFAHFKDRQEPSTSVYDPHDPQSYDNFLHTLMSDSVDYENAFLAVDRSSAQLYYYGYEPSIGPYDPGAPYIGEDPLATLGEILNKDNPDQPNRSTFVSTDVRDAVMMMLPGLVRLFGASEAPVYLVPRSEAEVLSAEQATAYVNYTFWNDNPGFLILYGAFKDALTVKTGFVKWWTDSHKERQRKRFLNVTADQIQAILSEDDTARIFEIGKPVSRPPSPMPPQPSPPMPGPMQSSPVNSLPGALPSGPPSPPSNAGMPGLMSPPSPPPPPAGGPPPAGAPPQMMGGAPPAAPPPIGPPPGPMAGAPTPSLPGLPPQLTAPPPPMFDYVTIEFEVSKPLIKVAGVPPEEMRIDRYARTFRDSRVTGHERIVPVDQLIAMGYDRELCLGHIQTSESTFTTEPQIRNPGRFMGTQIGDGVKYGEWYIKVDKDGDGVPELRYICTMGGDHEIVADEEANRVKFALFSCDPISHTIVGDSLADYTEDIQRIKTNMMRSILDSAATAINPKTVFNELTVTADDVMNDDVGAVIRTRGDPKDSILFTQTPFFGQQMLPAVQMLNEVLQRRTGLSDAAKGLDPKALQSSTMLGVEAVINGAQERVELVARVLAETGFKDLFAGLYNEVCENPNQKRTLKIRGEFVPYDTGTFDASMGVEVNENLGKGSDMVRMLALNSIKQDQMMVFQTFGPQNPVVGIPEMINTITDMLAIANIKNPGRYFKTPTPQQIQAIQSQPKTPDAMTMAAQAQMEKVRSDTAKAVGQQNIDRMKIQSESDIRHKEMQAKTAYDFQKLSLEGQKFGIDQQTKLATMASQLMKDQSDSDAQDQQNQMDMASAQQESDLKNQQAQNDQAMAMQKAASDHLQGMAKVASQHMLGQAKTASAHQLGQSKIASQHVLGALAARNDERDSAG